MSQKPKGKSLVAKQSVVIGGRKTSITLERPFWTVLKEIAAQEEVSFPHLSLASTLTDSTQIYLQ
jgi:predicted DNA-binding ribbon-helix-helix protein